MVTSLLIVAGPSFYNIFKKQLLSYNSNLLVQRIQTIQSSAFLNNIYYKIEFNNAPPEYKTWQFKNNQWELLESTTLENIEIIFESTLSNTNSIVYGPNGAVYICSKTSTPSDCKTTPLNTTATLRLNTPKKDININFTAISGYVTHNIRVK